ncbi:hypothetical protein EDC96DRAFT_550658, partial [Choanephora cucurbitarum]
MSNNTHVKRVYCASCNKEGHSRRTSKRCRLRVVSNTEPSKSFEPIQSVEPSEPINLLRLLNQIVSTFERNKLSNLFLATSVTAIMVSMTALSPFCEISLHDCSL